MNKFYYIEAFIRGHQQYQVYDKMLDSNYGGSFILDLRVYKTEQKAKAALELLKKEYPGERNTFFVKSTEIPTGFEIKNNRLKRIK